MTKLRRPTSINRQKEILRRLQRHQEVTIPALAKFFNICEMTARRDLDKLQASGQVRRTHGGAIAADRMVFEFNFSTRRRAHRLAKQAIASEAVKLIRPGSRVILDTGTTTLELACLLKDFQDLTVLTPSLAVASELQFSEGIETVLLGGIIRRGSPDLTGPITEAVLEMFAADIAFQGADAIDLAGVMYTADMRISRVDQRIRNRAERTYVLADSSKFGQTALARCGLVSQMDALITDDRIRSKHRNQMERLGVRCIVAALSS